MRRGSIAVRTASVDDIDAIIGFSDLVRGLPNGRRHRGRTPAAEDVRGRYQTLLINPSRHVILAVDETDQVLGMAVLSVDVAGELLDVPVVRVSHLVVDRSQRRRGAGRALIAAAGSYANEVGVEHVSVGAVTTDREANRFLARLGFAPVSMQRIAPLPALRHHLAVPESNEVAAHVVRRNSLRIRRALARQPVEGERDLA
ncbi:MAG: GNAT family N-acetyltransferase [Actinomycetota bacterium]|nr:GNAT family N-acetyltransferase [Actinomycetota bacterium]